MKKTYRNPDLTVKDERFQRLYGSVADVVSKLGEQHEVIITFNNWNDSERWRRRAYEFMNIVQYRFSLYRENATTLRATSTTRERREPVPAMIDGVPLAVGEPPSEVEIEQTEEEKAEVAERTQRVLERLEPDPQDEEDPFKIIGGSHNDDETGGTESRGDEDNP